jgi:hypothetical protein
MSRNNRLKNCLAFSPKRCTVDNAWPDGQNAVGSMLATADLSGNYINSIGDIQQHKYLECLILASNCITRISGLQGLEYLSVRRGATADFFLDSNTGLYLFI